MISQSLHFEITGNDATRLIQACQQLGMQSAQAVTMALKAKYANQAK